jgi:hypothetical protein
MERITCFLPYVSKEQIEPTLLAVKASALVGEIYLLATDATAPAEIDGCKVLKIDSLKSSATMRLIAAHSDADYSLVYLKQLPLQLGYFALDRMVNLADDSAAGMIYADSYQIVDGVKKVHPVIAFQEGSLRDDFDFGSVLVFCAKALKEAVVTITAEYSFAGLYDLWLKVSQKHDIVHINEYLYSEIETDTRKSGEKMFDYVDPKNRQVQVEMELVCTDHLKKAGAYLAPQFKDVAFDENDFPVEASVIIPVFNRVRTLEDAIRSVLKQVCSFDFNLIIIDNHSSDGTAEIIEKYASDARVIHLIPGRFDLGIGGCWNVGVQDANCGKFAVQLDSDDVYSDENTLQKIVDAFYEQKCAMVVGTYRMTNFDMETIPPGIIDHKEWTPDNGRNNALRINGLGAPRAFYTPMLRAIKVPNTSYGEDYALGLYFSREHRIGRIYDVLYLCRRWDDNSDASLDIVKMNGHNTYKDRIRTWEVQARKQLNKQ